MVVAGGAPGNGDGEPSGSDVPGQPEPLRPISYWVLAAAALAVALVAGLLMWVLVGIAVAPSASEPPSAPNPAVVIDAVRTALTAAAGTGGAAALLLAFRRQRHAEQVAEHTVYIARVAERDRDRDLDQRQLQADRDHEQRIDQARRADEDARERRVTELYTRAVDQLGSKTAPVRLGGLYALERLAQDTPGQRQTVVNVLCAYLRMPYTPPPPNRATDESDEAAADEEAQAREEHEVRLTAQSILAVHLLPGTGSEVASTYWGQLAVTDAPPIDLDLTGAQLVDLQLRGCRLGAVSFRDALFSGDTDFRGAIVADDAHFSGAEFSGIAKFEKAELLGAVDFRRAVFKRWAGFRRATLHNARFNGAVFEELAYFRRTVFSGSARFEQIPDYRNKTVLKGVEFNGEAVFDHAEFRGPVNFDGVVFRGVNNFRGVRAFGEAKRVWPSGWVENVPADDPVELVRAPAPSLGLGSDGAGSMPRSLV